MEKTGGAGDPDGLLRLERRLRSLPERAMRRAVAREALLAVPPEEAYRLLVAAVERPETRRPRFPHLRDAVHEVLIEPPSEASLSYPLRARLYALAREAEDEFAMRLLRTPGQAEEMEDPAASLPRSVADIPLGVRRSIARGEDPHLLEKLLLDPDPIVLEHLLANDRVTEEDVIRIAARRPIPGTTLASIHRSRRFGRRPRILLALARNPYCPADVAIAALSRLPGSVLADIERDATLHESVRRHAADELARRGQD